MNSHADIRRRLAAYSGGELDLTEHKLVEMHLASCPTCRSELADMKTTLHLLKSTPEVDPPPWLTSRIMAHLREEPVAKRNWLQRICFPQHTGFPVKVLALLMVCVSGYYLSRTVESDLRLTNQQRLQELPAPQTPTAPATLVHETAKPTEQASPTSTPPLSKTAPALQPEQRQESTPIQTAPQVQSSPAPATYAPAPPAFKDQPGGKAEALRAAPAAESNIRIQETPPEKKAKSSRSLERMSDTSAPVGRAAGAPAGIPLPQIMVRLNVNDPIAAPDLIREAVARCGGSITEDQSSSRQRLKARIPAERQQELLNHLQRLGKLVERPAPPPAGAQLLELTIQW